MFPLTAWRDAGRHLLPPDRSLPPVTGLDRTRPELETLLRQARSEAATPWPAIRARDYARYFRDGDRDAYEQLVFARQARLARAAVLAAVDPAPERIDEVADGVITLCEQSTWCWPAHDATFTRHGAILPTAAEPHLDLGAGEVAGELAWIDHLLGDALDEHVPGLRARIRHEVDRRVLTPFTARRADWHWLALGQDVSALSNWSPWIHGNLLVAALRLVDDPGRRCELVDLVVEGLDRYAASLPADGAIDEGYGYWWNGACRLFEAMEILQHATGDALDDSPWRALREVVAFPHRMHLGGPWYVNQADSLARPPADQPWDALYRAARRVGDAEAVAHATAQNRTVGELLGLGRLLRSLTDPDWNAAPTSESPLPQNVWLPSTQTRLVRATGGSSAGLTLVVKGGHNDEHHNHNDVGSFVVARDGVPVLVDPGRPTYTAQTFGPDRYAIWTMRSPWHNTPVIAGHEQSPGRSFAARSVTADDHGLTLDLAGAYPIDGEWQRTARLVEGTVTVHDRWRLEAPEGPTSVHLLIAGTVHVGSGSAEVVALDGAGRVRISWEPAASPCSVTVRELDDPMQTGVWGERLTRLDIDVSDQGSEGALVLTVREHR